MTKSYDDATSLEELTEKAPRQSAEAAVQVQEATGGAAVRRTLPLPTCLVRCKE